MKGWLIVNGFVRSEKFDELYGFFKRAAEKKNVCLSVVKTDELICPANDDFSSFTLPDFAVFWDKDVNLAKRLEQAGLPLFNSAKSIALCDNKIYTAVSLSGKVPSPETVPVPKTFEGVGYTSFDFLDKAIKILGLPIVIKEAYGSFGNQVYLAESFEQAKNILLKIAPKECLLQRFVKSSCGKDVRINVVGGKIAACMLRTNKNDFRSNVTGGGTATIYEPTDEQKAVALKACEVLGLDFAGVDVLFGENGKPLVCEVNSNPHFKSVFDCTGVDLSKIIIDYCVDKLNGKL